MSTKLEKPTTWRVLLWDCNDENVLNEVAYPMHIYSFEDVVSKLEGNLSRYDIFLSRYSKRSGKLIDVGGYYVWNKILEEWIKPL